MALIAERAGVAVQTVYFTFRTKDALLQEVHGQTVLGRGTPVAPTDQPWYRAAAASPAAKFWKCWRTTTLAVQWLSRFPPEELSGANGRTTWHRPSPLRGYTWPLLSDRDG